MKQENRRRPRFFFLYPLAFSALLSLSWTLPAAGQEDYLAPVDSNGLLLWERPDPGQLFKAEDSTEPAAGVDQALERAPVFKYSQDRWNKARTAAENGTLPRDFQEEELSPMELVQASTEAPSLPPPEVELPSYGTSLSVTGRKVIGFNFSSKRYVNEQTANTRPRSINLFDITQQLQIRMQGKVGPKITVNVDYDDAKPDKQDISVVYQGDPQEVVQSASFGDIDLSLPATEFVSYNKQLFGIRVDLKHKGAKFTFVGSRTKGQTKTKQFVGTTQFQGRDILDTQYLRRQYYDLTFGNPDRLPIKPGSEKVYVDNQSYASANNINIFALTADDLNVKTSSYTGKFLLLSPGVDYTVDYVRGILTFRNQLNSQDVVAVDFTNNGGSRLAQNSSSSTLDTAGTGNFKLVKTLNDIFISSAFKDSETGYNRELKTYYSIGQSQIVRDDGRGNFTLKVQDLNRTDVGAGLNPAQKYPENIEVDFEQGLFHLIRPFGSETDPAVVDPQVYAPSPVSKRIIRVEYRYRFKTFLLEPSLVVQSETIMVDNVKMTRNLDYFIDYDSGFVTFYNEDRIRPESTIDITYDVSPFGGLGTSSLIGTRLSYDFGSHMTIGGTMLYESASKTPTVPNITDLTKSLMVYEGDVQFKNIKLLPRLNSNWAMEVAQSRNNPNLNDAALVDNMEGVKQQDSVSLDHNFWRIASNPDPTNPSDPSAITWISQDIKVTDINPNSQSGANEVQQVLNINYDFSVSSEVSIVYPFSDSGLDFSKKNVLELVVQGDGDTSVLSPGPQVNIHLGQINEDADNNGGANFSCSNGAVLLNAPKSEDLNCDAQLQSSEDTGWRYSPPGLTSKRYGAGNGRIDSEDLNHNGRLDPQDFSGGDFGYVVGSAFVDTSAGNSAKSKIDFSGWHTLQVPFTVASTETFKWSAVRQARVTLKKAAGGKLNGTIRLARLAVVGNTWEVVSSTGIKVAGVNNVDNTDYKPIFNANVEAQEVFKELYGSIAEQKERLNAKNITEQALKIDYTGVSSGAVVFARRSFLRQINIAQHKKLRFLLYNNNTAGDTGASFFLRVGNESNYLEVSIPLTAAGSGGFLPGTWRVYSLEQADITGDKVPDVWRNSTGYDMTISSTGTPSLQQVSLIMAGIRATDSGAHTGSVWLNEIHVTEPDVIVGTAKKVQGDFEVPGWGSFGGKYRKVDKNFQTPVSVVTNQDNEQDTGYLNVTRLSFFPMSFNLSRQITDTPNTLLTGDNNLVNLLQQGVVKRYNGSAAGNFTMGSLPRVGLGYTRNYTKYEKAVRRDDQQTYNGNLNYTVPLRSGLVPKTVDMNYSLASSKVSYDSLVPGFYNTDERVNDYGARLSFTPWQGSSFNPAYTLREVRESRTELLGQSLSTLKYPKSMQQTAGFSSNFQILSWLNPSVNYSVTAIENNNLTVTTVTVSTVSVRYDIGEIKTVNRSATGGVSLNINANDLLPRVKLLRSMNLSSSYQIQDGDSWQNAERDFSSKPALWVRTPLRPKNALSQRSTLTLRDTVNSTQRWQPIEAYELSGRLAPLRTLSLTNNYSESIQRSETTGTQSKSVSRTLPDLVATLSQVEALLGSEKWMSGASINFRLQKRTNETISVSLDADNSYGGDFRLMLFRFLDTSMSYNTRSSERTDLRLNAVTQKTAHQDATLQGTFDISRFRFTSKVDYATDNTVLGTGVVSQNVTAITPSLLVRADLDLPRGLMLPFMKKPILFSNRIIWTTTTSYMIKRSPVTMADNSRLFSVNTSADYEIAKNLRLTMNGAVQRLWNKFLPQEDYISYQAGSTLTFQF